MLRYLVALITAAALQAGVMDFRTLADAKSAYEGGEYEKASELYAGVKDKNDHARYNYGDALYKQKKYEEAAQAFESIGDPSLRQKALHNLGNSLAMAGKTDKAIAAYEAALKLGEDEDTRYNLEQLKKQKEQQQKKQDQKNDRQNKNQDDQKKEQNSDQNRSKNDQNKNDQKSQDQQQNKDQQQNGQDGKDRKNDQNDKGQSGDRDEEQRQQNQEEQSSSASSQEEKAKQQQAANAGEKNEKEQNGQQAQAAMAEPISDMEERKYNQMLDRRGIKTLMIPLNGKGEPHDDETTPW